MPDPIPAAPDIEATLAATVVTDVQLSPDGEWVLYATAGIATEKDTPPAGTLWLVAAVGGTPRRLTSGSAGHRWPRWSPDGHRVAFLSDRDKPGTAQAYLLDLHRGGEAVRITGHDGGVLGLEWSPDGSRLALLVTDPGDEPREDHDENVAGAEVRKASLWLLAVPDDAAAGTELPEQHRLSPADTHVGGILDYGLATFGWAPSGDALVATFTASPVFTDQLAAEVVTIDLQGRVRSLGTVETFSAFPRLSPDGATVAVNAADGVVPALFTLQTMPAGGGPARVLVPDHPGSFFGFSWLPGGELLAIVQEGQQQRLVVVDPAGGEVRDAIGPFDRPGVVTMFSVSADGRRVALVRADNTSYGEVHVADLGAGTAPRRLTDLNPWTHEQEYGEVRELSWTSFDGLDIQGLLVLPVGFREGRRYPLLLQIHGGPMGAWLHELRRYPGLDWSQFLARRGYAVLLPNPRGSSGRGTAFLSGIAGSYGEPDFEDLMSGVDAVIDSGVADPERLVVGGWSGGGYLTNWTITHTDRFKAAVSGAGIANWVSFQGTADCRSAFDRYFGVVDEDPETHWLHSPIRYVKAATTPTLILYGDQDARVPPSQGHELHQGLRARGVETQLVLYPREAHAVVERHHQADLLHRVIDWLDTHLGRSAE